MRARACGMLGVVVLLAVASVAGGGTKGLRRLWIDSLPRGADVFVAGRDELPEGIDVPQDEDYYMGKSPLTLLVPPGEYCVHVRVALTAFIKSPKAKAILEGYAIATKRRARQMAEGGVANLPVRPPFEDAHTDWVIVSSHDDVPHHIGYCYRVTIERGAAWVAAMWWPTGATFEDMEPLMPPATETFNADHAISRLQEERTLPEAVMPFVAKCLRRCGMAWASFRDPEGEPKMHHVLLSLGPPGTKGFRTVQIFSPLEE